MTSTRKLKLFAAGGAGCNVASQMLKYANKQNHGFAEIDVVFIDTSKSNIDSNIPEAQTYLVDGLDGSGKLRASNYQALNECSKEILHMFKPGDVNVILSSASGGSGSIIGPILASELLDRGETVIVITIGSTSSRIEVENTLKTLKSYEAISQLREVPVVMAYRENAMDKPRSAVDSDVLMMIMIIASMFSGNNRELDKSDLRNFLNYHKVTSYTPKLSLLDFFSKEILVGKNQALVSLVSLIDERTSSDVEVPAEYQAVGFVPAATREILNTDLPLHAAVISGYYNGVADRLNKRLAVFDEIRQVVVEKSIAEKGIATTRDGIVL